MASCPGGDLLAAGLGDGGDALLGAAPHVDREQIPRVVGVLRRAAEGAVRVADGWSEAGRVAAGVGGLGMEAGLQNQAHSTEVG